MNKYWQCAQCKSTLEKKEGLAMTAFMHGTSLQGMITCGICGAKYNMQDVYGGKYDIPEGTPYDFVVAVCDPEPEDKDALLVSLLERFHIRIADYAQGIVYQQAEAGSVDAIFVGVVTRGLSYFRKRALDLDDDSIRYQPFELTQGRTTIGGHFFMMRGKR
jgi:hypothetical protein